MKGFAAALILDRPPADSAEVSRLAGFVHWFAAHHARHLTLVGAGTADPAKWQAAAGSPEFTAGETFTLGTVGEARHFAAGAFSLTLLPPKSGRAAIVAGVRALSVAGEPAAQLNAVLERQCGPVPDVILAFGGRLTLNDAFVWHAAYAEFVFLDTSWTEATLESLATGIAEFAGRDRRFGNIAAPVS